MWILKFIVNNQKIIRDPNSNFDNLNPNEELIVDFSFNGREWNKAIKVAAFFNADSECPPQKLIDGIEDAFMKLNYNADTKTYINQNDVESKPVNHMLLTDTATGKIYKVTVTNGQLNIVESIN